MNNPRLPVSVYLLASSLACLTAWSIGRNSAKVTPSIVVAPPATEPVRSSDGPGPGARPVPPPRPDPVPAHPPRPEVQAPSTNVAAIMERSRQRMLIAGIRPMTEREAASYVPKFQELGLSKEQAQERMQALEQIHLKSFEVNSALAALATARQDYDKEMRQMLGPDSYAAYRRFEDEKPARNELEAIRNFLGQESHLLEGSESMLVQGITDSRAFASAPSHGAYGPVPSPLLDPEEIRMALLRENENLVVGGNRLLQNLRGVASAELLVAMEKYYQSCVAYNNAAMAARSSSNPEQQLLEVNHRYFNGGR